MDYLKLAQRTISMLNSMIESGECHTERTREMVNNAQNGLEQLRHCNVSVQNEQLVCPKCNSNNLNEHLSNFNTCYDCDYRWAN